MKEREMAWDMIFNDIKTVVKLLFRLFVELPAIFLIIFYPIHQLNGQWGGFVLLAGIWATVVGCFLGIVAIEAHDSEMSFERMIFGFIKGISEFIIELLREYVYYRYTRKSYEARVIDEI